MDIPREEEALRDLPIREDGTIDQTVSPMIMAAAAEKYGAKHSLDILRLAGFTVYPTDYVAPRKRYERKDVTFARHLVNHSWKNDQKLGRKIEKYIKHKYHVMKYLLLKKY